MLAERRARTGRLPAEMDDFVGRDVELDKIVGLLLSSARLITLVGPGGIGKTRLATEVVRRIRKSSRTPVYWVRLARLTRGSDVAAVEKVVAYTVVESDFCGRSEGDALIAKLAMADESERSKKSILVMDNCEHVLEGAGQLISELLEIVPGLTILATSREAVGWVDEHVVMVSSLSLQEAVALFRQRSELTGHPVATKDEIAMASRICRHMNNYPLYIRLAAARLMRQPLAMIVEELSGEVTDKRMRWTHWPRFGAETRHRGVRDAIVWSYDLCLDQERLLLDRMSVFAAGYDTGPGEDSLSDADVGVDLEAIEVVCADDPRRTGDPPDQVESTTLPVEDIGRVLERLVDQSLVTAHITATTVRYSLLESVRVFAGQRLQERSTAEVDEPARLAQRHRRYYLDKVVAAQKNRLFAGYRELQDWIRSAWDNFARAIETSILSGEPALGMEIATGMMLLPIVKGSPHETCGWAERTLRATRALTSEPNEAQIRAMALIGWSYLMSGKTDEGQRMFEECVAACLRHSKISPDWRARPQIDAGLPAPAEFVWGAELLLVHRDPIAVTLFARAREKFGAVGDVGFEVMCSNMEAWAAGFVGSEDQALRITRRHLDNATASGSEWITALAENARAVALAKHGNPREALAVARSALAHHLSTEDKLGESWAVHIRIFALGLIIADMTAAGNADRAELAALATETARLAGGAATLRARLGVALGDLRPFTDEIDKAIELAREVLGQKAFATAQRQGSLLRPEAHEVERLALGTLSMDRLPIDHPARKESSSHWHELSTAEQQVAVLAAAGWTNAAIAIRRGSSSKTIDAQMAAILRKLIITSREEIIKLVPENQIGLVRVEATKRPHRTAKKRSG
ncbi:putative ATPase [Nocardia amikacinitolerans]|nr:putative ATPase [Nocardia amikacinitolerans]